VSNNAVLAVASYVVNAAWQVAVLASAGWVLARWARRAGPELQHKIWIATLILATFVPATPLITSFFAHRAIAGEVSPALPASAELPSGHHNLLSSDIVVPPAVLYVVSGLYVAALLFCFLRLCRVLHRTATLVRRGYAVPAEPDYAELWHTLRERFSVPTAALLRSADVSGPVTASFRRPILLVPVTLLEDCSRNEFLAAVAHECAHMKRDDFRKNVFYEIVCLFTIFHPLTWFIKSQIAQTREMICDRMAADQLSDPREYALSLLQLAGKMRGTPSIISHAVGMFDTRILERRIMTLTTSVTRLSRRQRFSWTVTALLFLSVCAVGIGLMTRTVSAQSPQPAPDLSCTYYDQQTRGHEGTCAYDSAKTGDSRYRCGSNADPARTQVQISCEWKLRRAGKLPK
jgi:beta-lactamase regulating signal transducer with metallopeptidase domain